MHASESPKCRNYLRVRGEYYPTKTLGQIPRELPPRTRRIQLPKIEGFTDVGTTSAYAENTHKQHVSLRNLRNYLRVRGEYPEFRRWEDAQWELPPRTRRIPPGDCLARAHRGTTSAYAENTLAGAPTGAFLGNYLRVRGEYHPSVLKCNSLWELPPRTRRIP